MPGLYAEFDVAQHRLMVIGEADLGETDFSALRVKRDGMGRFWNGGLRVEKLEYRINGGLGARASNSERIMRAAGQIRKPVFEQLLKRENGP